MHIIIKVGLALLLLVNVFVASDVHGTIGWVMFFLAWVYISVIDRDDELDLSTGFVDLSHLDNTPMFYDLETNEVIKGNRAKNMRLNLSKAEMIGQLLESEGRKAMLWEDKPEQVICGIIYKFKA